jgi:hypothetical protein
MVFGSRPIWINVSDTKPASRLKHKGRFYPPSPEDCVLRLDDSTELVEVCIRLGAQTEGSSLKSETGLRGASLGKD